MELIRGVGASFLTHFVPYSFYTSFSRSFFLDTHPEPKTLVAIPRSWTRSKHTLVQVGSIFHEFDTATDQVGAIWTPFYYLLRLFLKQWMSNRFEENIDQPFNHGRRVDTVRCQVVELTKVLGSEKVISCVFLWAVLSSCLNQRGGNL